MELALERFGFGRRWYGFALAHDEYGTGRVGEHLLGDAAEQQPRESSVTPAAHYDQIDFTGFCRADDLLGRIAGAGLSRNSYSAFGSCPPLCIDKNVFGGSSAKFRSGDMLNPGISTEFRIHHRTKLLLDCK